MAHESGGQGQEQDGRAEILRWWGHRWQKKRQKKKTVMSHLMERKEKTPNLRGEFGEEEGGEAQGPLTAGMKTTYQSESWPD